MALYKRNRENRTQWQDKNSEDGDSDLPESRVRINSSIDTLPAPLGLTLEVPALFMVMINTARP